MSISTSDCIFLYGFDATPRLMFLYVQEESISHTKNGLENCAYSEMDRFRQMNTVIARTTAIRINIATTTITAMMGVSCPTLLAATVAISKGAK